MVAHDPESRPDISEVAATFRTLTDRATGPSLESFAHAHAVLWLENIQADMDETLDEYTVDLIEQSLHSTPPYAFENDTTAEGAFVAPEVTQPIRVSDPTTSTVFDINAPVESKSSSTPTTSSANSADSPATDRHRSSAVWLSVFFFGSGFLALACAAALYASPRSSYYSPRLPGTAWAVLLKEFMNYGNCFFNRLRMKNFLPEMFSVHDTFREIP